MKLYNGYERLARNYTLMTDAYEFTMSQGYVANDMQNDVAVFDLFFRKVPNNGGYAVMAGLDKVIPYIQSLNFDDGRLDYFKRNGFSEKLIEYLKNFKFKGDIYAVPDGTPVFPNEPLITVKAPLVDAVIIETCLLSLINGAMEHMTGARRVIESTPKGKEVIDISKEAYEIGEERELRDAKRVNNGSVMEFGARRADGPEAAIDASIYGMAAGCVGTSNVMVADMLNKKAMGTMAHSWIETFPNELDAFRAYAKEYPDNCILLVDTVDTLKSGLPNAIKVFKEMKEQGIDTSHTGIRIDSGDLAYLSKKARKMLDEAGCLDAKICLSNGLNANTIESLTRQGAVFDSLGVGDNISKPEGRMGCVYKEVGLFEGDKCTPKIKLSNDTIKIVNPGFKRLYRCYDKDTGYAVADVMAMYDEEVSENNLEIVSVTDPSKAKVIDNFDLVLLQKPIFVNGELVYDDPTLEEKQAYCNSEMQKLYPEVKRLDNPHEYYVDGTRDYVDGKYQLIKKLRDGVSNVAKK